jgi:hypothetical protein
VAGDHHADSSGVPWEGRTFQDNPHAGDTGETPADVTESLTAWRAGTGTFTDLVAAFADNRFLIPLVTHAGDDFDVDNPVMEDKVQELSVITVAGPNGEKVIPAFTSVAAMSAWNSEARPIPIDAQRVALAAASEQTDRIVVNPGTDSIVLRRPVVWSIAQGNPYTAPWESSEFLAETRNLLAGIDNLVEVEVEVGVGPGDPNTTGDGPDVTLVLGLIDGLDADRVQTLVAEVQARISNNDTFVNQVDALALSLSTSAARP